MTTSPPRRRAVKPLLRRVALWAAALVAMCYGTALLGLLALRWINPPFTAVHIERRIGSWRRDSDYRKRYLFVPLGRISADFQHAVLAAEDGRFFEHHGFDWVEVRKAIEDDLEGGRLRGASTITQQLVKNLFLSTQRSFVRKGIEFTLVPPAEWILSKQRILELYLNVIEWGPGVYGAEAAARFYCAVPAARVSREQGARLAAILPAPRTRQPGRMNEYSARILERMRQRGW